MVYKNKEDQIKNQRRWRNEKRKQADKICGKQRRLILHKKDGKPHEHTLTAQKAIKNPESYVKLCEWCHKAIHWNMKFFGMTWKDVCKKLEES